MKAPLIAVLVVVATGPAHAAGDDKEGIVVMPLKSEVLKKTALAALNELLVYAVTEIESYNVVSKADIEAQLNHEQMKDLMGCDMVECAAEIGGALGTRYLLTGSVRRLGSKIIISLSLIDTKRQKTKRGQAQIENNEDLYGDALEEIVGRLFRGFEPTAEPDDTGIVPEGYGEFAAENRRRKEARAEERRRAQAYTGKLEAAWRVVSAVSKNTETSRQMRKDALTRFLDDFPEHNPHEGAARRLLASIYRAEENLAAQEHREKLEAKWKSVSAFAKDTANSRKARETALSAFLEDYPENNPYADDANELLGFIDNGRLVVLTEPDGADIAVNGKPTGKSPYRVLLPPGQYDIALRLEGHFGHSQAVSLEREKEVSINLLLKEFPMNPYAKWGHRFFWTGLGLGAAMVGVGYAVADGQASEHRLRGSKASRELNHHFSNVFLSGFVVAGVGMGTGIILWLLSPGDEAWSSLNPGTVSSVISGGGS